MGYAVNGNYNIQPQVKNKYVSEPPKKEVELLTKLYKDAIEQANSECRKWSDIQREEATALYEQFKGGEISEKVLFVRQLLNDAMAHRTYARCDDQAETARHRLHMLKQQCPEYFKE